MDFTFCPRIVLTLPLSVLIFHPNFSNLAFADFAKEKSKERKAEKDVAEVKNEFLSYFEPKLEKT